MHSIPQKWHGYGVYKKLAIISMLIVPLIIGLLAGYAFGFSQCVNLGLKVIKSSNITIDISSPALKAGVNRILRMYGASVVEPDFSNLSNYTIANLSG